MDSWDFEVLADNAAGLILQAQKVVVFTGAGISTESGISDFRSPGGIWEKFDPDDFTYEKFLSNPESRRKHWQLLREGLLAGSVVPNAAHHAIAELEKLGKLDCVITQNMDGLHQVAGLPDDKVFELHGNMGSALCLECGRRYASHQIEERLSGGEEIPDCEDCRGILKPAAVLFGEQLPEKVLAEAIIRAKGSDLFIVIGSALGVYPAAYLPMYAHEAGAKLIIINLSLTLMDGEADLVIRAKAGEAMSRVVQKVVEKTG